MSAIIFDFDGTIADSFGYVFDFLAEGTDAENLEDEQRQQYRSMSGLAIARTLGYSWLKLPGLFLKGRNRMQHAIKDVHPFDGMPDVIEKLHAEGHELFIVSTNTVRNIHDFLHHNKLQTYFLEIYGGVGLFGKAPALRKLAKDQKLDFDDCIYIGDELRDIEAAQSLKMRVIAVSWGFAKREDLKDAKPTAVVDTPEALLDKLQQL